MEDVAGLAARLKARARELGADLAGLAAAGPLPESTAYVDWLAAGHHGSMSYMARNVDSRRDIVHWYPQARSVLMCAFSYSDNSADRPAPRAGRLARYARLLDYHDELRGRMTRLLAWLKEAAPDADGRLFVDSSPLLERLYARYAGLGWVGKNSMLISPRLGSYFFLSGLALSVELPADEPQADRCGSCRRCLEACPTDAFPRPRVLDAARCIAYLTIEHRGAIPEGLREGVGDWIMGCDVCQEVCPWNRFAKPPRVFQPALEGALALAELAGLDQAEFLRRFRKTPLARPKHRGILRNILLALGNSRQPAALETARRFLRHPDPVIAEQAAWSEARLSAAAQP